MGMQQLQTLIQQAKDFRDEIELFVVEKEYLTCQIEELDKTCDELQCKKDDMEEKKKKTESQNEDMEKQVKAKVETAMKRTMAKLNSNKNPEMKLLEANIDT